MKRVTCSHGVIGKASCGECQREYWRARRKTEKYKKFKLSPQFKARKSIENGLQKGGVVKPEHCQLCWEKRKPIHGHHQDYSKLREVIWLCHPCHGFIHGKSYQGFREAASK